MFEGTYVGDLLATRSKRINQEFPMMILCMKNSETLMYDALVLISYYDFIHIEHHLKSANVMKRLIGLKVLVEVADEYEKIVSDEVHDDDYVGGKFALYDDYYWKWRKFRNFAPWLGALIGKQPPIHFTSLDSVGSALCDGIKYVGEYLPDSGTWNVFYKSSDTVATTQAKKLVHFLSDPSKVIFRSI